jgi:hypothetical protein
LGDKVAHICNDCGNHSTTKFPGGKCPACNSYNIKNTHSTQEAIPEKEPRSPVKIVILCIVWALFFYGAWDRYIRTEPVKVETPAAESSQPDQDY